MLPRAIGLTGAAMPGEPPTSVTVSKYSQPLPGSAICDDLDLTDLGAEGSIPPPRCRHHVAHSPGDRGRGPLRLWSRRRKRPLAYKRPEASLVCARARMDRHCDRDDHRPV